MVFLYMNTNMLTFLGSNHKRCLFMMFPAELKTCLTGALVADVFFLTGALVAEVFFLNMNTSMLMFLGNKHKRCLFMLFPAELKTRSTGVLVAAMQNSLHTPISRAGYFGIFLSLPPCQQIIGCFDAWFIKEMTELSCNL